jgi:hypothetical protein
LLLIVAAGWLLGCGDRSHMSDGYGRSSRAFFAKQHVYAQASTGAPVGLDSEESSMIQARYKKTISGGSGSGSGQAEESSRVLLLQDPGNAGNAR